MTSELEKPYIAITLKNPYKPLGHSLASPSQLGLRQSLNEDEHNRKGKHGWKLWEVTGVEGIGFGSNILWL